MNKEELLEMGFKPERCKIGTLYMQYPFFCRLDDDKVLFYCYDKDTEPLGEANTKNDIYQFEKEYYQRKVDAYKIFIKAYEEIISNINSKIEECTQ